MKKCPFCGKDNLAYVVMCGYCGERFRVGENTDAYPLTICVTIFGQLSENPTLLQANINGRKVVIRFRKLYKYYEILFFKSL